MKALENRTLDSKIEMEIMDALDEIKAANRRHEAVDTAKVLQAAAARRDREVSHPEVLHSPSCFCRSHQWGTMCCT